MLGVVGDRARDHLRDALVVAEELDHGAPHAVVQARAEGAQRREVRERHLSRRVGGEGGRGHGVEDRLGEAPPLLDPGEGGLQLAGARADCLLDGAGGLLPGGLEKGGDVALDADVVGEAARGVQHRGGGDVVPVGLAVLPVAPKQHPRGAAVGHGLAQLGQRRHVGRRPREQPEVVAEDLPGGVAGLAQKGGVGESDLVFGRARVEHGDAGRDRLDRALDEAQPPLLLPSHEEHARAVAEERGVERLGQGLVGARGERDLDRALGAEAQHEDGRLVEAGERADAAADRDAVHDGEERVEDHEVQVEAPGESERLDAVRGVDQLDRGDVQDAPQEVAGGRVAARDQDRGAGGIGTWIGGCSLTGGSWAHRG